MALPAAKYLHCVTCKATGLREKSLSALVPLLPRSSSKLIVIPTVVETCVLSPAKSSTRKTSVVHPGIRQSGRLKEQAPLLSPLRTTTALVCTQSSTVSANSQPLGLAPVPNPKPIANQLTNNRGKFIPKFPTLELAGSSGG